MELGIRENGLQGPKFEKDTEYRFGLMDQSMRAGGERTKQMEREGSFMLTETCMKENGRMTKLTVKESTLI